jgi:hypothetical protein
MSDLKRLALACTLLLVGVCLAQLPAAAQDQSTKIYLPTAYVSYPPSIFGIETGMTGMSDDRILAQARNLGPSWLRLNGVSWSAVEPVRGAPYNWTALIELDRALAQAQALGLTPVVIVRGTPSWAAADPSGCASISDEYFADYARFMAALVKRYRDVVRYWEMGNEPDIDWRLAESNFPFGCWGNIDDPYYYGGERYGRMLMAVAPAMRDASPGIQIINGGLLLNRPLTTDPTYGHPEQFLEGMLRAGAANSFDILAFHSYPMYVAANYDHDLYFGDAWPAVGGWTFGKTNYVRAVMARYGVSKPLWLNETGMVCVEVFSPCAPPPSAFFDAQADYLVRMMSRAASLHITQISWYTLEGPGWESTGLLDGNQSPRPAFEAYRRLIAAVGHYTSVSNVDTYGLDVEAYRFSKPDGSAVDVLWSRSGTQTSVSVPVGSFRTAVVRDGASPGVSQNNIRVSIPVGFRAVFIERLP